MIAVWSSRMFVWRFRVRYLERESRSAAHRAGAVWQADVSGLLQNVGGAGVEGSALHGRDQPPLLLLLLERHRQHLATLLRQETNNKRGPSQEEQGEGISLTGLPSVTGPRDAFMCVLDFQRFERPQARRTEATWERAT